MSAPDAAFRRRLSVGIASLCGLEACSRALGGALGLGARGGAEANPMRVGLCLRSPVRPALVRSHVERM